MRPTAMYARPSQGRQHSRQHSRQRWGQHCRQRWGQRWGQHEPLGPQGTPPGKSGSPGRKSQRQPLSAVGVLPGLADEVDVVSQKVSDRVGHVITDVVDAITGVVSPGTVLVVIGVISVVAGLVVIGRGVLIRRALSEDQRTQLTVIPAESFDPTGEEVARYAAQLARMRRSFVTRPAQAVRLRLDAVGEGQVAYRVEGPSSARSILQTAGYYDVELHPGDGGDLVEGGAGGGAAQSEPADETAGAPTAAGEAAPGEPGDGEPSHAGDHDDADRVRASDHDARASRHGSHGEAQPHRRNATGDVEGARR